MVEIRANSSFSGWFEVVFEGQVIEEVQGRRKALRIAREVAKKNKVQHIVSEGKVMEADDTSSTGRTG
ncbi:MAG: hypothetical protein CMI30_05375 [Opitutae bacterium]|jgi:hypothetical protein|nr:hypothetical protein [Opitutae bacterium]|tara:strand:- start:29 stop:232 length:204 start_codon:yes stop_codon:yes gene_type:complete